MGDFQQQPPQQVYVQTPQRKDYIVEAIITFVLYWLFWIPGFIANIFFLNSANQQRKEVGEGSSGFVCLWILLIINILPMCAVCAIVVLTLIGGSVDSTFTEINDSLATP